MSIASSIYQYRLENGRRYHAYRDGQYWGPNDQQARSNEVIWYVARPTYWMSELADFAEAYPNTAVVGTDLSPIQPDTKPPNLYFEIDDCCSDWVYPKNHFDYIHVRMLYGSVADWPKFYKECFDHLAPGGYIEQAEINPQPRSDDGSITPGDPFDECGKLAVRAGESFGKSLMVEEFMHDEIIRAGFTDVVRVKYKWPIGAWSNDVRLKELGRWVFIHWYEGLEGWVLRFFTKHMGWTYEDVQKWNAKVRQALKDRRYHIYTDYRSAAATANGRIKWTPSGQDRPRSIRLQQDDKTGAQLLPWVRKVVLARAKLENEVDKAPRHQDHHADDGVERTPAIRSFTAKGIRKKARIRIQSDTRREGVGEIPQIRKYSLLMPPPIRKWEFSPVMIRKFPRGLEPPLKACTTRQLASDIISDDDVVLRALPGVTKQPATSNGNLPAYGIHNRKVKPFGLKSHRLKRSSQSSTPNLRRILCNRPVRRLSSIYIQKIRSLRVRKSYLDQPTSNTGVMYPKLPGGSPLPNTMRQPTRLALPRASTGNRSMRNRRTRRRIVRQIVSVTPASLQSLVASSDDAPAVIGRRRHRRYVIRDKVGREAHIQYTGSTTQQSRTASLENPYRSDRSVEQDTLLLKETEDLLQLWVPDPDHKSSRPAAFTQNAVLSSGESARTSPTPGAQKFPSKWSQYANNAAHFDTNLPYATSPEGAASSLRKSGRSNTSWIGNAPAANLKSYDMSNGHSSSSSIVGGARSLHTCAIMRQQLETQSSAVTEANRGLFLPQIREVGIRKHLRSWQDFQNKELLQDLPDTSSSIAQPSEHDADMVLEKSDDFVHDDLEGVNAVDVDQDGDLYDQSFLRSGDVADMSTKSESMLAVFIRQVGNQAQFYNVQGKWFHQPLRKVVHTIPRMFSLEEIEPILPYLPIEEVDNDALDKFHVMDASVPRSAGATLLERLRSFHQASAEVYRDHLERINRVHSLVGHEWQRRELSLQEITSIVLQKPDVGDLTEVELYTIHKELSKDLKFRPHTALKHRISPVWQISPLTQIRDYEQVKRWLREHLEVVITQTTSPEETLDTTHGEKDVARLNPISRFVEKARALIKTSRQHRKVTAYASIGPDDRQDVSRRSSSDAAYSVSNVVAFDAEERIIVEYLKDWVLSKHIPQIGITWSLSPMLLRAVGMYEGHDLTERTGSLLLRELGVIAPWENDVFYSPTMRIPYKYDGQVLQQWKNASNTVETMVQSSERLHDPLEDLRTDWGDMNVYCIDDAGAQEIDDGLSVEKINGQDSMFWLHIHVANPTAFIDPGSHIAQYAETLLETHYFPEKVYAMLDSRLTQRHLSLAKDRPVLTLSAKITTAGETLATKITPGWIRKMKRITPDRMRRELKLGTGAPLSVSHTLTVGQYVAREEAGRSEDTPLSTCEISELRLLHRLAEARRLTRSGGDVTGDGFSRNSIPLPTVFLQQEGLGPTYSPKGGRQFIGDPIISWEARETDEGRGATSQDAVGMLVAELMIMAGEIAARWCGVRNIPIPYRGTVRNPSLITTPEAYKAQILEPVMEQMGYVPQSYRRAYGLLVGTTQLRSSPFRHGLLGIPAYTKATSPLRRYPDMLVHWQIQAALLYEARHGQGALIDSHDDSYLPFSRAKMDAMIPTITGRELRYKNARIWSINHWVMQLLHRAFEYKQAPLPLVYDVQVHTEKSMMKESGETMGYIMQLSGFNANLLANEVSDQCGGFRVGDWWQAKMERVETFRGKVVMTPIRLTKRISDDIQKRYKASTVHRLYQASGDE
ncbi:MAG: hypothetical protein Q9169_000536 [Polycauliona sp. 2 TL-2023]